MINKISLFFIFSRKYKPVILKEPAINGHASKGNDKN